VRVREGALEGTGTRLAAAELEALGLSNREIDELLAKLGSAQAPEDFTLDPSQARPAEEFARKMEAAVPAVDRR
jgi:hypothetical protein